MVKEAKVLEYFGPARSLLVHLAPSWKAAVDLICGQLCRNLHMGYSIDLEVVSILHLIILGRHTFGLAQSNHVNEPVSQLVPMPWADCSLIDYMLPHQQKPVFQVGTSFTDIGLIPQSEFFVALSSRATRRVTFFLVKPH